MLLPENGPPTHPGEFVLYSFMLPSDITLTALASSMGIPREEARMLIDGEIACTPRLAEKLATALETEAEFWLSAQSIYDAWLKREGLYESYYLAAN